MKGTEMKRIIDFNYYKTNKMKSNTTENYPLIGYPMKFPELFIDKYSSHIPNRLPNQRQRRKLAAQNRRVRVKK